MRYEFNNEYLNEKGYVIADDAKIEIEADVNKIAKSERRLGFELGVLGTWAVICLGIATTIACTNIAEARKNRKLNNQKKD